MKRGSIECLFVLFALLVSVCAAVMLPALAVAEGFGNWLRQISWIL